MPPNCLHVCGGVLAFSSDGKMLRTAPASAWSRLALAVPESFGDARDRMGKQRNIAYRTGVFGASWICFLNWEGCGKKPTSQDLLWQNAGVWSDSKLVLLSTQLDLADQAPSQDAESGVFSGAIWPCGWTHNRGLFAHRLFACVLRQCLDTPGRCCLSTWRKWPPG